MKDTAIEGVMNRKEPVVDWLALAGWARVRTRIWIVDESKPMLGHMLQECGGAYVLVLVFKLHLTVSGLT